MRILERADALELNLSAGATRFSLVARTSSISKGAKLAHLAVGAASKRTSDLEDSVGAVLLERHSRGVKLTPAGLALQRHAQRILADVDQIAAELSDHAAGVVGVVRLWANTSAVTQFLPDDLARFVAAHPGIRIELQEKDSSDAVLDGRADLGVFAEPTATVGRQTERDLLIGVRDLNALPKPVRSLLNHQVEQRSASPPAR